MSQPTSHSRRQAREFERLAAAAARSKAGALEAALAEIGAAFDAAAAVNDFKLRVERRIRLGPQHGAVRARYRGRAELLYGRSLADAIAAVERWWRAERKAFQIAAALGCGNRLSLEVLRELRLILRLLRYRRMAGEFSALLAAVRDEAMAEAAE